MEHRRYCKQQKVPYKTVMVYSITAKCVQGISVSITYVYLKGILDLKICK